MSIVHGHLRDRNIIPSLIQHYAYGGWQGTLKIQECFDGIFKILRLDLSISLIQPLEAVQFPVLGETPARWTRPRHFPDARRAQQFPFPTACGLWHDGAGFFLTLYICTDYWSLMDPLRDLPYLPFSMQYKLHTALSESFRVRNLLVPTLPQYRQSPRIAI